MFCGAAGFADGFDEVAEMDVSDGAHFRTLARQHDPAPPVDWASAPESMRRKTVIAASVMAIVNFRNRR